MTRLTRLQFLNQVREAYKEVIEDKSPLPSHEKRDEHEGLWSMICGTGNKNWHFDDVNPDGTPMTVGDGAEILAEEIAFMEWDGADRDEDETPYDFMWEVQREREHAAVQAVKLRSQ